MESDSQGATPVAVKPQQRGACNPLPRLALFCPATACRNSDGGARNAAARRLSWAGLLRGCAVARERVPAAESTGGLGPGSGRPVVEFCRRACRYRCCRHQLAYACSRDAELQGCSERSLRRFESP